ncbi:MAG: heme lyase CcmF/NrfE family subunit [Alphaproteobacteria bacterium]
MAYLNELGHLSLWIAFALAICGTLVPAVAAARGNPSQVRLTAGLTIMLFVLTLISFAVLMTGYIRSDFSLVNVATNSHTLKPLLYKISGTWGNHEGSLLLWLLVLTGFGAAIALTYKRMDWQLWSWTLSVQCLVAVGFFAFVLLTSNPFERLFPAPLDGKGLNPLLQDPGLAFHPPLLYLGYVGLSTAFSFGIAALLQCRVDVAWARWVRPWVLIAWAALTAGIALGSWWAYYELGWGGFWFWDPVENASLMPWFFATALLHCVIVVEKRDSLKAWTIMLSILGFSFSLLGTFLVRSGIITSVHTFASDPTRGVFILAILAIAIGGALLLFAFRAAAMENGNRVPLVSREGALLVNNFFLSTAALTVLVGTMFPLVLELVNGNKISVGPQYFNATVLPILALMSLLMGIAPLMSWRKGNLAGKGKSIRFTLVASAVAALLIMMVFAPKIGMSFVGLLLGVWLVAAALLDLWDKTGKARTAWTTRLKRLKSMPIRTIGTNVAHAGVGIFVIGLVGATAWIDEDLRKIRLGDTLSVGPYEMTFTNATRSQGPNYEALTGEFLVNGKSFSLKPETRFYSTPPMQTTEAAIHTRLTGDLFVAIAPPDEGSDAFSARFFYRPFQAWIWAGSAIMILGGLLAMVSGNLSGNNRQKTHKLKEAA